MGWYLGHVHFVNPTSTAGALAGKVLATRIGRYALHKSFVVFQLVAQFAGLDVPHSDGAVDRTRDDVF